MDRVLILLIVSVMSGPAVWAPDQAATDRPAPARSKIYKLEELAWPQVDALDRLRTMFILPIGMMRNMKTLANEAAFESKLENWLSQRKKQ